MVWGCMSIHGLGDLVVVDGNMNHQKYIEVLESGLPPSIDNMFEDRNHQFIYQRDNVPCHRPRAAGTWLDFHNTPEGCNGLHRVQIPISSRIYGMICPN